MKTTKIGCWTRMKILKLGFLCAATTLLFVGHPGKTRADSKKPSFVVIVHPTNPTSSMSKSKLARLFLKKSKKWSHGSKSRVLPVDLRSSSSVRKSFSKRILGKSANAVKSYWQQQIFSGAGVSPPEKSSDARVRAYVAAHPGAIGYISSKTDPRKTKVIRVTK